MKMRRCCSWRDHSVNQQFQTEHIPAFSISSAGQIWDRLFSRGKEAARAIPQWNDGDGAVGKGSSAQAAPRMRPATPPPHNGDPSSSAPPAAAALLVLRPGLAAALGGEVPGVEGRAREVEGWDASMQPSMRKGSVKHGERWWLHAEILGGGWGEQMICDRVMYQDRRSRLYFPTQLRVFISSRDGCQKWYKWI